MPARLIINADDFGLTVGINRSIEELHRAGALSSATLMANGPAFADAVAVAHRNPTLGVGCHVVLTDGTPISPPDSIPSLIGSDGQSFHASLVGFAAAALRGHLRPQDIRTESLAQIRKLQAAGLSVTHLDTHKHAHIFPAVSRPLLDVARQTSVRAIRNSFEPPWNLALGHGTHLRRLQIRLLTNLQRHFKANMNSSRDFISTTDGTVGISATGHLDAPTLSQLLQHLPPGTWELVCHPGYNDSDLDRAHTRLRVHRNIERLALTDVIPRALSLPGAPTLIHFGEI